MWMDKKKLDGLVGNGDKELAAAHQRIKELEARMNAVASYLRREAASKLAAPIAGDLLEMARILDSVKR